MSHLESKFLPPCPSMSRLPPRFEDDHLDEEAPFLPKDNPTREPTPLPRVQIVMLLSVWLVESLISHSISPYLNQVLCDG